ncbi:hypothetical protein ACFOLD_16935, partial [Kocuria carniphila]
TNNGLWLGAIAVILVLAALTWISSVKKAFARAQGHLATRLPVSSVTAWASSAKWTWTPRSTRTASQRRSLLTWCCP